MPWPEKQRVAIFLDTKRRKGESAARALMHEAGYSSKSTDAPARAGRTHGKLRRKGPS